MGGAVLSRRRDATLDAPSVPLYALSKLGCEGVAERYAALYGIDAVAVRFSDVYGAMDRDTGARNRHNAPYHAATRLCRGDPLVVSGGLEDVGWDYVDAPSAARAVVALLTAAGKPRRRVYEIALGRTVPHGELLAAALGVSVSDLRRDPSLLVARGITLVSTADADAAGAHIRTLAPDHWLHTQPLDPSPLRVEYGWTATPLDAAMAEYTRWLKQQPSRNDGNAGGGGGAAAAASAASTAVATSAATSAATPPPAVGIISMDVESGLPVTCHPLAASLANRQLQSRGERAVSVALRAAPWTAPPDGASTMRADRERVREPRVAL